MSKTGQIESLEKLLSPELQLESDVSCAQLKQAAEVAGKKKGRTALASRIASLVAMLGAGPAAVKQCLIVRSGEAAATSDFYRECTMPL